MRKIADMEEWAAAVLLIAVSLLTLLQVIMRYFFSLPLPWVEEAARYLMIFMIFIASAAALYRKEHLNIEILDFFLSDKNLKVLSIFHQIIVTLFTAVLAYVAYQFVMMQIEIGQKSPALQLPMAAPMSAVFIGAILMMISGIGSIYMIFTAKKGG
ncbi:TRAP transporter small permease [Planococcus sp. 1R117A]|uniref:TRAP transporter small permease n=1 Tax=Planococcus sp. 1R117A TaxID=3447020 RepID=UPI003EDC2FD4